MGTRQIREAAELTAAGVLFSFVLFHSIVFWVLSHCSEVSFSGWWTKEFLTLNKSDLTTDLAEGELVRVGGCMSTF